MVGAATVDSASSNPALSDPASIPALKANNIYHLPAYNYIDLAASFKLLKGVQFNLGVNNLLDKAPNLGVGMSPNDYGAGFHNTYDSYGRYVHSSLQFTF